MQTIHERAHISGLTLDDLLALQRNGYGVLPLPPGAKYPPPQGTTGANGTNLTAKQIARAHTGHLFGNLGVRLPAGVIGLDCDAYADKEGAATWAALCSAAEEAGTPMPYTTRITSRAHDDAVSGIRLFRATLPEGREWLGGLPGLETIRSEHRYAVIPPSIHPEGRTYAAINEQTGESIAVLPPVESLPLLPPAVVALLTRDTAPVRDVGPRITPEQAKGGTERGYGEPCKVVRERMTEARAHLTGSTSRHDAMLRDTHFLARHHEQGHTGALGALDELRGAFIHAVTTGSGMVRSLSEAQHEYDTALAGAWRGVAAETTPEDKRGCCLSERYSIPEWTSAPKPNPNPQPLGEVLTNVREFLTRHVVFPSEETATAATLWTAHAHALVAFDSTPRLAFLSPEPGSGKSRALEVIATLVPRPMHAVNATPAALFRSVGEDGDSPTILFDEIDTVFGPKTADGNEDVRGFINAGHRRGAVAYRCVGMGTNQTVQAFPAYCAMALAGLNELPDTIGTRSIIVAMRKRAPHERVTPWRTRNEPGGHALRAVLSESLAPHMEALGMAEPEMPAGVEDRPADVWEPLLAIADAAGGDWPSAARSAASRLTLGRDTEPSRGVQLLTALHTIWEESGAPEHLPTTDILAALNNREEEPWPGMRNGAGIDARGLAGMLGKYGVKSRTVRVDTNTAKGYSREQLWDPWARYCSLSPERGNKRHMGNKPGITGVSDSDKLPAEPSQRSTPSHQNPDTARDVSHVTDVTQIRETEEAAPTCPKCQQPMDAALPGMGFTTHPTCT